MRCIARVMAEAVGAFRRYRRRRSGRGDRRALVRAHILERLQVARSGEFRAADNSFPWSIYGRSMVYLWSIPWSIYDLSQVFVGFRHFACVEQKNKQFLSSRPKAKKLVKREIDHR